MPWNVEPQRPLSPFATGGVNSAPVGTPFYNFGKGQPGGTIPKTAPWGQANPAAEYLVNAPLVDTVARTFCCEDREVGASFIVNPATNVGYSNTVLPGFTGTLLEDPSGSRVALTTERGSGALFLGNSGIAPLATDPEATFDARHYYPSAGHGLSAMQVAQLRQGMIIDVGPATPSTMWSGMITGWATDGTSVAVQGWFQHGNQAAGQVPAKGSLTVIDEHNSLWDANFALGWGPNQFVIGAIGIEQDIGNSSGTDATLTNALGQAFDAVSSGTNTIFTGYLAHGPMLTGFYVNGGSFAGYVYGEPPGASPGDAVYANQSAGSNFIETHGGCDGSGACALISAAGNETLQGSLISKGEVQGADLNATGVLMVEGASAVFPNLPRRDPHVAGELWNDRGVVHISGG
jgi:hypothetical protein